MIADKPKSRELSRPGMHDLQDVGPRAREGDAEVDRVARVLGGAFGRLDVAAAEIERQIRGDAVERAMQKLRVVPSRIGDDSGTLGLSRQLVRTLYSPEAIDAASVKPATQQTDTRRPAVPAGGRNARRSNRVR